MIYILLPAFNEELSLNHLLPKIHHYFTNELKLNYHILACDDGSRDQTFEILQRESAQYPITVIKHKINRGLGETIRDLFEAVAEMAKDDDVIIRMDCDDTHEPHFIKGLIDKLNEGYDVVIASRFVEGGGQEGLNLYRKTISRLANIFLGIFINVKGLKEYSSGYRAYRPAMVKKAISVFGNNFIQLKGLGFTCTIEKVVKFKIIGARIGEAPMVLRYDLKKSQSKMVSSITTLGYFVLVLMYRWPFGGWKSQYKHLTQKS